MMSGKREFPPEQLATSFELWAEYFRHLAGVSYAGIGGVIALAQFVPETARDELALAAFCLICAAVTALIGTERTLEQVDEWTPVPRQVRRMKDWSAALIILGLLIAGIAAAG